MPDLDQIAGVIARAADEWRRKPRVEHTLSEYAAQALHADGLLPPEGFVAVPREPTEAMIAAGCNATRGLMATNETLVAIEYRAMIQAQADHIGEAGKGERA